VLLKELPNFRAKPGTFETHHKGQINTPLTRPEWSAAYNAARNGRLTERVWIELYFQSVYDRSVVPDGLHLMSVFAQYVPYKFAEGDWNTRGPEARDVALASIGRFCSNLPDAVVAVEAMGPPDIERKVGLTGGHIFQGECLPAYMWNNRLSAKTSMPGVFLCGACTHPGGSVIAVNGRNAAVAVLRESA
jgi:phytoene dehydrogenase-like protein